MITEENLDSDSREVHYVSENGRVEGLILNKSPIETERKNRPKSAKGGRRTISRDGRFSASNNGDITFRAIDIDTINEQVRNFSIRHSLIAFEIFHFCFRVVFFLG